MDMLLYRKKYNDEKQDGETSMKNIIIHILIVVFGIGWIICERLANDDIKLSTAVVFTVSWTIILIIHIIKEKNKCDGNQ